MAKKEENTTETVEETKAEEVKAEKKSKAVKEKAGNDIAKMNIYEKLSAITNEIGLVIKSMDVEGKYKAVSETDVLNPVKELEKKYRVYSYPYDRKQEIIPSLVGRITMRVETVYRFINLDKPAEYVDIKSYGDGVDTLDKAPGKAMTYADKYALMKAYKISTGDDPDQHASPEVAPTAQNKPSSVEAVKSVQIAPITKEQLEKIKNSITPEREERLLTVYNKKSLEEFSETQANGIIRRLENEAKKEALKNEKPEEKTEEIVSEEKEKEQ